eukprot:TRINITY_DN3712_c0_g1_i1.p1 TRINITY_DN3712_c0_g1~~TRINITY_DN3712_c0_g1_i1.p1  ORF type:complete len:668 (+),score=302.44 TRINITY_DN3712_c0_g1_i1:62-2065(+)
MKSTIAAPLLLAAVVEAGSVSSDASVTPIQKVVTMMSDMLAKAKQEKHTEQVEFAKFQSWCESARAEKTKEIDAGAAQMVQLNADIDKAGADASVLEGEVKDLQGTVAEMEAEKASAMAVRDKERADYEAEHADLSESIDAIQRAIAVLKSRTADVPQSLMQLQSLVRLSSSEKSMIDSLLKAGQAPEANAYEFQSGSVIDMLEKLESKFVDERVALEKAELNARGNYEVLLERLVNNIKNNNEIASEKTAAKAGRLEDKASAQGDLALTEKSKASDEQVLTDTTAVCQVKSAEFEKNQVTRAEEIQAIEKAVEIISSGDVAGSADEHLPALIQSKKVARSLAQLRSTAAGGQDAKSKAAAMLKAAAQRLDSRYLSVMAAHVSEDPFDKVKKMIKDLIVKLMEEANSEADHNSYCTSELATNKQTRENKGAEVEELTAQSEKLTAEAAQLSTEITKLADHISEIRGQQAEAEQMRIDEKATNTKTVEDAQTAQVAVQKAISVLREFYAKVSDSSAASSLVQTKAKGKAGGKAPYTGMQSESGGIFGMLEVIESDFARLESETSSEEDQATSAHKTYMAESTQDLEVKETEKTHKEGSKRRTEEQLRSTKKELELTQEELDGAMTYYDKLKTDCVDTGMSYEERKQRRADEIQSLQEALKILNGEDLA